MDAIVAFFHAARLYELLRYEPIVTNEKMSCVAPGGAGSRTASGLPALNEEGLYLRWAPCAHIILYQLTFYR